MNRTRWNLGIRSLLSVIAAFALAVCDAEPPSSVPPDSPSGLLAPHRIDHSIPPRTMDVEFEELAKQVPEFGGLYFDDQRRPVVFLTDLGSSGRAEPLLRGHLARQKRTSAGMRFVQGQFGFADLAKWRRQLNTLLGIGGVWSTDIDETTNRVLIGIESDAAWALVLTEVERLGIPPQAVTRRTRGPVVPDVTLQQYVPAVGGGLQIKFSPSSVPLGGNTCTFGFVTNYTYFVTNSHCSTNPALVDNTTYYQPSISGSYQIGTEIADPPVFQGGPYCPPGNSCRWSDSIRGYFSTGRADYGYIEKTTGFGSITIAGKFRIIDFQAFPSVGDVVNKVGRTTGWSQGPVMFTCQDIPNWIYSGWRLLCQDEYNAQSAGGDSGSPVFRILSGNDVKLYGIHWGQDPNTGYRIMSALVNIEYELGDLEFFPW